MYEFTAEPRHEQDHHISKGLRKIIDALLINTHCANQTELMYAICDILENRYGGESLEYHIERMGCKTTKDIQAVIESYFASEFKDGKIYVRIDQFNSAYNKDVALLTAAN